MPANASAQVLLLLQTYGALTVLGAILVVGIWRLIARYVSARAQTKTTTAFRERFDAFVNSSGEDTQAYERLAFLAERMGNVMGRHALADSKPPFAAHSGKTYVTVLQYIPELRRHFADERGGGLGLGNDGASWVYHSVDDALIRFLGALDETTTSARRKLINPIAWFREGVEAILALPFYILGGFGLLEDGAAAAIEQRTAFRAVAGLVALIAVATIASILIVGEQRTANAYRAAGNTAASAVDGAVAAVVSAFSDVSKAITAPKEP
jgi:hypothetical protein